MLIDGVNIIEKLNKYKDDTIVVLGHEYSDVDSIISGYLMAKVLNDFGFNASFCITDKVISNETKDILNSYGFDASIYQKDIDYSSNPKFILVDHNNRKLDGEIIMILDHHPISHNIDLELYFNKSISSTSLYLCKGNEHLFSKEDITLAILAATLDTASFNSTKAKEEDKRWCLSMCDELGINYDKLYESGLYFTPLDNLKECSLNGLKKYNYNNKLVESSYVHINNDESNNCKIKEIVNILKEYVKEKQLDMFVFIVHNMSELKTTVYKINDKVEKVCYNKYTSRGNDIMPSIEKELICGARNNRN